MKMKGLSMAISSPVRPEKFPPPSRKFSRSRSSLSAPAFHIRGGRNGGGVIGDEEPYSPKVTCIGQVRPRKTGRRRRCWLWRKLLRPIFSGRKRVLMRVLSFLRSGYCKRVDAEEGCLRKMEALGGGKFENVLEVWGGDSRRFAPRGDRDSSLRGRFWRENLGCGDAVAESRIFGEECSASPRNVGVGVGVVHPLMLTRCKSEPATRIRERSLILNDLTI